MTRANEVRLERPVEYRLLVTVPSVVLQSGCAIVSLANLGSQTCFAVVFDIFSPGFFQILRLV